MMIETLDCKYALVEFGECDKNGYVVAKGEFPCVTEKPIKAHPYWYPDDITQEEINQEILDLAEHYKNVAILLPIPAQLQFEVLKHE